MRKHLTYLSIVVVLLAVIWSDSSKKIWKDPHRVIQSDVIEYYGYLPATFIYHDLTLKFRTKDNGQKHFVVWAIDLPNGNAVFKYTMGPALMYAPFFLIANELAVPLGYNNGGYSAPYRLAIVLAALIYLLMGLLLLRKSLLEFFSESVSAAVLLAIGLGTNLFWYSTFEPGMAHVYDFFLASVFVYLNLLWYKKVTFFRSVFLGLTIGLLTLIRPINLLIVVFFVLYNVWNLKNLKSQFVYLFSNYKHLILMMLAGFVVLIPQMVYWKEITGQWIYYSYGKEGFFFLHPHLLDVLFGFRKGWFIYTPVMLFAALGIIILFKKFKKLAWPVFVVFILYLYIVSSWWSWWYGGSLGQRALIDIYPVMAFPMAAFFQWIRSRKQFLRILLSFLVLFSVVLGAFYNVQYYNGAIHWDSMTRKAYFDSFGKIHPSAQFKKDLQAPDYENALLGKPEEFQVKKKKETIQEVIKRIKSDPKWFDAVKEKAKNKNISVDSMLQLDARYVLKHK